MRIVLSKHSGFRFLLGMLLASSFLAMPAPLSAQGSTYYVSPAGADTYPGTISQPFATVQYCAQIAQAGDTCLMRAGAYRESITPPRSGAENAPITFAAYPGESVTISGADLISGWNQHNGAIYRASMPWNMNVRTSSPQPNQVTNNQLFVDGVMMPEARWPNITPDQLTRLRNCAKAQSDGASHISEYGATYQDSSLAGVPAGLFNDGKINFGPGTQIIHTTCDVVSQTNGSVSFQCNPDPGAWNQRTNLLAYGDLLRPTQLNYYYLWGKLEALDAPAEWFRAGDGYVYLWTPDSDSPANHTVEARRRLWAFDLSDRSYIVLDGLRLFAAGIKYSSGTQHTTVQNAEILYPWHFMEIPIVFQDNGAKGLEIMGSHNVVRDSLLAFSPGIMLSLGGTNNRAENNVIREAGYMGIGSAVGGKADDGITNPGGSAANLFSQNSVFVTGRLAVTADSGLNITYNDLYQSHQQITDLGTIYAFDIDGKNADIAYNLVHDNEAEIQTCVDYWGGYGIFLDDNTYNYRVYRNIIWNTTAPGIATYGTNFVPSNRVVAHNTIDGRLTAWLKSGQSQVGTQYKNNIRFEVNPADTFPSALDAANNFDGDALVVDRVARDYMLRPHSPAIDAGTDLGSPYTDSPMISVGQPDIGALEAGRADFLAGAVLRASDLAQLTAECYPQGTDTAICQVTGLPAGRRLPADFQLAVGSTTSPGPVCETEINYAEHQATGRCQAVPISGLNGLQPAYTRIGTAGWVQLPEPVDLGPLTLFAVSPNTGSMLGGTHITLTGRRFDPGPVGFQVPVTVSNPSPSSIYDYQVLVLLNTADLISNGKLGPTCNDIRFSDDYGALRYWLEGGCSTTAARLWVRLPYLPPGSSTFFLSYGDPGLPPASSGSDTFVFFDDFNDDSINTASWSASSGSFYSISEQFGQMVMNGQTSSATQYDTAAFSLNFWQLDLPATYAIDSEMTSLAGSSQFKANLGVGNGHMALQGAPSGNPPGKSIAYYAGSWQSLGRSTVAAATFSDRQFSIGVTGSSNNRTLRWFENGDLTNPLATRSGLPNLDYYPFSYGPDAVTAFDARFDNIRIRHHVLPEPITSLGSESWSGLRVTVGGLPCRNLQTLSGSTVVCQTPPGSHGSVSITVTNPDESSHTLPAAFTYRPGVFTYLPIIQH